jgi:D-alanyl-D-alanine dipeptidase
VSELIAAQHSAYSEQRAPKIADPVIKAIPIEECGEALVDVTRAGDPRITMMPSPQTPFASPECNSGYAAAPMIRETVFTKLQTMLTWLDALAPAYGFSPGTIDIKVFEGLRSLKTQAMLFDSKVEEVRQANPTMTEEEIINETSKWLSPTKNNTPVHSTGGAVDIRLWNTQTQAFVDMGMFGVIWGRNDAAPTYSEDATSEQKRNRLYLLTAAMSAGLVNYPFEWWHFSTGDRYASYWLESADSKRNAVYGGINDESVGM